MSNKISTRLNSRLSEKDGFLKGKMNPEAQDRIDFRLSEKDGFLKGKMNVEAQDRIDFFTPAETDVVIGDSAELEPGFMRAPERAVILPCNSEFSMGSAKLVDRERQASNWSSNNVDTMTTVSITKQPKWSWSWHEIANHPFCVSVYRRLFAFVFIVNMVVFISILASRSSDYRPTLSNLGTASSANILVAILMRQEYVVNALFRTVCCVPNWFPLWIRRRVAKVYHYGGFHSGCAAAAVTWFLLFAVFVTHDYLVEKSRGNRSLEPTVVFTYVLLFLLLSILASALPAFRAKRHNAFEMVHRVAGWSALAMFWAHTVITAHALRTPGTTLGHSLAKTPAFWFISIATISIILPWLRLRKVDVRSERLSPHALRMHFNHVDVGLCQGIRISHNPLKEWHAFATIANAETDPKEKFSLIVSNAGDWTKRQIGRPPNKVWVRGIPVYGVLRVAPLFRRALIVTTGSGIGPCLSFLLSHSMPCKILWSTPKPLETYGQPLLDLVHRADENPYIIDTTKTGRLDMVSFTYQLCQEYNAEAIFVISNPKLTFEIVGEMERRGVPAYGPIWDS